MCKSPRIRINQITIPLVWSHKASPYSSLAQQGVLLINVKLSMPRQLEQACGLIKFEENFSTRVNEKSCEKLATLCDGKVCGMSVAASFYVGRKRKHEDERVRSWLPRLSTSSLVVETQADTLHWIKLKLNLNCDRMMSFMVNKSS